MLGIPDEMFIRDEKIPMTKEEIRVLALSKAKLFHGAKFVDIGSGTGSVTVEAGLYVGSKGKVYAVEKDPNAVELTRKNIEKFDLHNVTIIQGESPDALKEIREEVDAIFVGGSERLKDSLVASNEILKKKGRIVLDAILLETAVKAMEVLNSMNYNPQIIEVIVAKGMKTSKGYAMLSRNPIFIIYGEKP
ncbi:precorrin-6Y C5,15-methyltransferase(decarboxylating), CbiT subunit [Acidianus hospitalis W1]|uniref:Probable cobalt-precorrin-6B C(15)-methyltransferase (decarboxylating) n=1 Tax=Acidianus hospitalis (strain W1) TaxID=933801 RepID=F4B852_ACIHW|nr:precorrin-6Y C5,15-methyltransferase (decarboxylating) subunit CbiT [Acidianus hospitalis]AEE94876.1 precorrin-6Y C5,15-methyltransferase(decarboxylating), CbiT subunit [Acidianus hospitalis W1]